LKSLVTLAGIGTLLAASLPLLAQTGQPAPVNQTQQLAFAGLRSSASQGQFNAVQTDTSGNLYLLLDQKDGVRLLKTDNSAVNVLAQAQLGAAGDIGLALALDPAGNVYVTGTTTSTTLTATSGTAIPNRTDASTNSFVAKFDANLNPLFVTFTGGSRIAASALAATSDAVFVTGSLFASNLPVTPNGSQQSPAFGSSQNGFVEKFSSDGGTLLYATYLTGAQGNTAPTGIAADASDHAYIVGATTASGFPTIAALVPAILTTPSGFLTKLTPAGDGFTFSTFISGPGVSSIALDAATQTLLLSGSIALGQFPIASVTAPIVPIQYQSALRIPLDGSAVQQSILLAPGAQSFVAPAASGALWVDGSLSAPFLPAGTLAALGSAFAIRVNAQSVIDQIARFGGLPNANPAFASLPLTFTSLAVDPSGEPVLAGSVQPTASSSLLASQTYDLPLLNAFTASLPSTLRQAETNASACQGSLCAGAAAYLAKLNPNASAPSLALSADDAPFLVLRNLGSAEASTLQIAASGASVSSNCPSTLPPGAECDLLLSGTGPATVTASAANATPQSAFVPAYAAPSATITFSPKELDFGLQSSASPAGLRTLTVTNLGSIPQTFTSATVIAPKATTPFSEASSDCPVSGVQTSKLLAPGATCHITLALTAPTSSSSDGMLSAYWQIGSRDVLLTAYSQAAALAVSAPEIDFGTQYKAGLRLPRFLYLSNASSASIPHAAVALPANSPFTLTDTCPSTIAAQTVCGIRIDYLSPIFPSKDSASLALDEGLSVLITGQSLPQPGVGGSTVDPNLTVTPSSIAFPNAVAVTSTSGATPETVSITNTGASPFSLSLSLSGDFTDQTNCASTLAAGQTCAVALAFAPSQPGLRQGLLAVTAGSGFSPAYVSLAGTGLPILPANNGTLDFGSTPIGQPVVQFYKVAQPFTTLTASATGPYTVLFIPDLGYGPGQPASTAFSASASAACPSCYLAIRFDPTAAGAQPGTLTLTSDPAGNPYPLSLTGIGLPVTGLLLTPAAQSFGSVPVNSSSAPILFTLTNATGLPATLTAPAVTGDFALGTAATGGQTCTGALADTASCLIQITFAPSATGARTGTLTVASTAASASAPLSGTGTPDPGLALIPNALTFNNVPGPSATQQTVTLTNTGTATLHIATPTVATTNFLPSTTCSTLSPTATCTITVPFTPASAIVQDTLSIPVTATTPGGAVTSTSYSVPLLGNYTASSAGLQIVPGQALFGPTPTSALGGERLFILNNLTTKSLTLTFAVPRQFAFLSSSCGSLAPNSSCGFTAQFVPLTNGNLTGSLVAQAVPSDGSPTLGTIAYLNGFGIAQAGALSIASNVPGSLQGGVLNFGQVASGQTGSLTLTLSNQNPAGSEPITVRRVASAPPFLSTTTCASPLDIGQSCTVTLNFAPTNQVATSSSSPPSTTNTGLLTLETEASSSPDLIDLTGQAGPIFVANPVNGLPLAAFALSQGSLTFPTTMVGNVSPPQAVTLTNTGAVVLHIASALATPDFTVQSTCATLLAGTTCTLTVTSTPQTAGTHIAALEIASDSTSSLDFISLLASSGPSTLAVSPNALDFGTLNVGSTSNLVVHVTNTSAAPIVFATIATTGDYAVSGTCPAPGASLPANQSCTLQVAFTPTQTGTRAGTLSIASSASTLPLTVALTGIGIQSKLQVAPSALAFGSLVVGASSNLTLTLTNSGTSPIVNLAFAHIGDYAVTLPCPSTTLAHGASCAVQVTFTPTALGARPGTLTLTSSDPSSPLAIPLTGTGIPAGSFLLTVNGGSVASALAASGNTASYLLAVTPQGYTGTVDLTCSAIVPGPYATCSLQPASVTLAGGLQNSIAILNTVTSATNSTARTDSPSRILPFGRAGNSLLLATLLVCLRIRRRHRRGFSAFLLLAAFALIAQGCGSGANPNLRYTPPGTYQYQVTASSTSGLQITHSVTLNLTIP
jgi:hypothetical protein